MKSEDLEKMKRHMGKGLDVELKGPDGSNESFHIEPLGLDLLPDLLYISDELAMADKKAISRECREIMVNLVTETVKQAYPKENMPDAEYNQVIASFVSANFVPLMMGVLKLNKLGADSIKSEKVDKIKELQERVKRAKAPADTPKT